MENDKGFRFLVGCFCIFSAWKLYQTGWLGFLFADSSSSSQEVANADAIGLLVQSILTAVDLVGYVAIALVAGAWPTIQSIFRSVIQIIDPDAKEQEDMQMISKQLDRQYREILEKLNE